MAIADPVIVRRNAGNRSPAILPEIKITEAITFSDGYVQTYTQKYDWAAGHPDYQSVKKASEFLAASEIRAGFPDQEDESDEMWDRGIKMLDAINEHTSATGVGGQVNIRTRPYRTNPANPNALYRRPGSVAGSTSLLEGVTRNSIVD